jgi:hypothetical protein
VTDSFGLFFYNIKSSPRPLRAAQKAVMASPARQHPCSWAAFMSIGDLTPLPDGDRSTDLGCPVNSIVWPRSLPGGRHSKDRG